MTIISSSRISNQQIMGLINWGEDHLQQAGNNNPQREIEWLLCDLLCCSRMELYMNSETEISPEQRKTLENWAKRRLAGEPLQYITGRTEFFGLPFYTNFNTLIPRPETERLVEVAIGCAQSGKAENIVDVGTGSGCIAVSLAVNSPSVQILAIDNNRDTLEIARKNADVNGVSKQINFQKLDIFREELEDKFDLMVSNPPYIPQNEISGLPLEIRDHEPLHALTDGADGLTFYRRFAAKGRSLVKKGGYLILEVGRGKHPQQVERIFTSAGYKNLKMFKDYNGDDRVLTIIV